MSVTSIVTRETSPFLLGGPGHGRPVPSDSGFLVLFPLPRTFTWARELIDPVAELRLATVEYRRQTIACGSEWWDVYVYPPFADAFISILHRMPWLWITA